MWYTDITEYAAIKVLPSEPNLLITHVELKVLSGMERKERSALIIFLKPTAKNQAGT